MSLLEWGLVWMLILSLLCNAIQAFTARPGLKELNDAYDQGWEAAMEVRDIEAKLRQRGLLGPSRPISIPVPGDPRYHRMPDIVDTGEGLPKP